MLKYLLLGLCVLLAAWLFYHFNKVETPTPNTAAENNPSDLTTVSVDQYPGLLSDISGRDPETLAVYKLVTEQPDKLPYEQVVEEYRPYLNLIHALHDTGYIKRVDWAAGATYVMDQFKDLFDRQNIDFPEKIEWHMIDIAHTLGRGEAVPVVTALLAEHVQEIGFEILDFDEKSDEHQFILVSADNAEKWKGTSFSEYMQLRDPNINPNINLLRVKSNNLPRETDSQLIRHLQKQAALSMRQEDSKHKLSEYQQRFIRVVEIEPPEPIDSFEINWAANALSDLAAKSLSRDYNVQSFELNFLSRSISYRKLAKSFDKYPSDRIRPYEISNYIMLSLLGKLSGEKAWSSYADPYVKSLSSADGKEHEKILAQFPLLPVLVDGDVNAGRLHELLSAHFGIDTRKDSQALYDAMVHDRIRFTRLYPDIYVSMYTGGPFSYLPLEILYVDRFIDLPFPAELEALGEKISKMTVETDDGLEALEIILARR